MNEYSVLVEMYWILNLDYMTLFVFRLFTFRQIHYFFRHLHVLKIIK